MAGEQRRDGGESQNRFATGRDNNGISLRDGNDDRVLVTGRLTGKTIDQAIAEMRVYHVPLTFTFAIILKYKFGRNVLRNMPR